MATVSSAIELFGDLSSLSFTLAHMADTPLNPFTPGSATRLRLQAQSLINCANTLHNQAAALLDQTRVDSAIQHVQAAQSLFDLINNSPSNTLTDTAVFDVVDSAISAAQAAVAPLPAAVVAGALGSAGASVSTQV
jgi:hypothetical protein